MEKKSSTSDNKRLGAVSVLNVFGFILEVAGGVLFGSVALLSDAFHMLFDGISYIIAFTAATVADRCGSQSYDLHRLEPIAAFINGILLFPMVAYIFWASYQRYISPIDIAVLPTILIAILGLSINVLSILILNNEDMGLNERGAYYHLLGDSAGSVSVIISVLVVDITGVNVIDPLTAVLISLFIIWSATKIIWSSSQVILQRTDIDTEKITEDIENISGAKSVQDIHVWKVCSKISVATVHIDRRDRETDTSHITSAVHDILSNYDINHATVEVCAPERKRNIHLDSHTHSHRHNH